MLQKTSELAAYEWDSMTASLLMRGISTLVKDECAAIVNLEPWAGVPEPSLASAVR
jgi:hypothetical protein